MGEIERGTAGLREGRATEGACEGREAEGGSEGVFALGGIVVKNEEVNSMHVFIHVQQYEYVDVNIWIDMHMNICMCVYGYICISYHTYYTYYILSYIYTRIS